MQRFFDVVFSSLALVVLSPVLLVIIVLLRLTGEGEIFFRQERVGRGGRPFGLLKFATMLKNSPGLGTGTVTLKNDPRILPVGRFLRKTKINELPQLLNILKGDMSVIGPRPQTSRCFNAFPRHLQAEIARVSPGLSGIGSIVFRDEEEILGNAEDSIALYDHVIAPYKGELEQWYVEHPTLRNYFLLILLTIWVVVFPRSRAVWRLFDLPRPPLELEGPLLRYPGMLATAPGTEANDR